MCKAEFLTCQLCPTYSQPTGSILQGANPPDVFGKSNKVVSSFCVHMKTFTIVHPCP